MMNNHGTRHILYIHNTGLNTTKANLLQVFFMCNAFKKVGAEVDLHLPGVQSGPRDGLSRIRETFGFEPLFNLSFYKPRFDSPKLNKYCCQKSLKTVLNQSPADSVFVRRPEFMDLALKSNKNVIFESHNNLLHNRKRLVEKYFKRRLIKQAGRPNFKLFVSISENLKQHWVDSGIPREKIIALHDGFDGRQFEKPLSTARARDLLGLPKDRKIVTYAGSLYPDRGVENIIRLAEKIPGAHFCVLGGSEKQKQRYSSMARSGNLDNIDFIGAVPHSRVPVYLYASDVLLALWSDRVPTIEYCSPLKVFEYMASGKNIVAHDFKPIREVLAHGYSGFLVDHRSFDDLSAQVRRALSLESDALGINARKEAYEKYTWETRAGAILSRSGARPPSESMR